MSRKFIYLLLSNQIGKENLKHSNLLDIVVKPSRSFIELPKMQSQNVERQS
jgi:hypothetical protein